MILKETYQFIRDIYAATISDLYIADVRIGARLTAVMLSDGTYGVASTLTDDKPHQAHICRDYGEFTPTSIAGQKVLSLFETEKSSKIIDTLRIAVLNAVSSSLLQNGNYNIVEECDPIELLELSPEKSVTMVGAFQGYIRKLSAAVNNLKVLEFKKEMFHADHLRHYVPAEKYLEVIPGSDYLIITGMTLVNNTIDGLLKAVTPETEVIVIGPSGSIVPDILFRNRVSMVGATRITRPEMLFPLVSEYGAGFHLFRYCAKKICIINGQSHR